MSFISGYIAGLEETGKGKQILPYKQLTVYDSTVYSAVEEGYDGVAAVGINAVPKKTTSNLELINRMPSLGEVSLGNGYKAQIRYGFIDPHHTRFSYYTTTPVTWIVEKHYSVFTVICRGDIPMAAYYYTNMLYSYLDENNKIDYTVEYEGVSLERSGTTGIVLKYRYHDNYGWHTNSLHAPLDRYIDSAYHIYYDMTDSEFRQFVESFIDNVIHGSGS